MVIKLIEILSSSIRMFQLPLGRTETERKKELIVEPKPTLLEKLVLLGPMRLQGKIIRMTNFTKQKVLHQQNNMNYQLLR